MSPLVITLLVLLGLIVVLAFDKWPAELCMLAALLVLVCTGVVGLEDALKGFSNPAVLTIGGLFVVGAGLQATGAVEFLSRLLLGRPRQGTPLLRLIGPVAGLSSFMNNTPLVAFMLPIFVHVAKRLRVSPSKLLIPLSYAAVLGGTCTLIGTSTNFMIHGMLQDNQLPGLGMWELAWIGVPVSIVGLIYLTTLGQKLLPNRTDLLEYAEAHPREYTLELLARPECPLVGRTIRKSGLRDLPGLYVYAIERSGERIVPVSPDERIQAGDVLCFSGIVGTIVDAQRIRGLEPVDHHSDLPAADAENMADSQIPPSQARTGHQLCEVVVSPQSPLIGNSVKDANFRARYGVPIIAVHRSGHKLAQKIGQIILEPGDTLLVDAPDDFIRRWRNSRDFILVSGLEDSAPVVHHRAWLSLALLVSVVVGMTVAADQPPSSAATPPAVAVASPSGVPPAARSPAGEQRAVKSKQDQLSAQRITIVALIGATLTILTGCLPVREAHRAVELPVLLLIASALGVSQAVDKSGAAEWIARHLLLWAQPYGKVAVLAMIVILTGLLTELLSNNACAALMGVLALATARQTGMDPRPLLIAVAVTSSYGFATPIGYQTNLMVLGPGGYKFSDYIRVGVPLDVICWLMTILVIPLVWSL